MSLKTASQVNPLFWPREDDSMTRSVLALLLGLVLWVLVASAVSPVLRVAFEGYRVAERRMTLTPWMINASLAFGAHA